MTDNKVSNCAIKSQRRRGRREWMMIELNLKPEKGEKEKEEKEEEV